MVASWSTWLLPKYMRTNCFDSVVFLWKQVLFFSDEELSQEMKVLHFENKPLNLKLPKTSIRPMGTW